MLCMMELIPNILLQFHNFMYFIAVLSIVQFCHMNAAMKKTAHKYKVMFIFKPFELILNCV